jgi:hypothetical protein
MRPYTRYSIVHWLVFCLAGGAAAAIELQEQTRVAYDRYTQDATRAFLERLQSGDARSAAPAHVPRGEDIVARPGSQDGIVTVPGGLIHHWAGAAFISDATLDTALSVSQAYNDYDDVYGPVIASHLIERDGNTYRALLRIKESAGGLSAVLDVRTRVEYFYPHSTSVYSVSASERVREVKDAGSPRERQLPAGADNGYLWYVATLNRYLERDGGLLVEMETLGLSRGFPPLLGWIIEPIARRLGRKSVEVSLREFRTAVRARMRVAGS